MTIYDRIKNRRKELGLTADYVANALGVSRATVYRYESSDIEKVPVTALEPLSKVLLCSPAYLMGWIDDATPAAAPSLSPDRMDLLDKYDSLNDEGKAKVLDYTSDLVAGGRYEKVSDEQSTVSGTGA